MKVNVNTIKTGITISNIKNGDVFMIDEYKCPNEFNYSDDLLYMRIQEYHDYNAVSLSTGELLMIEPKIPIVPVDGKFEGIPKYLYIKEEE